MRRVICFGSKGNRLVGTLDLPERAETKTGLLIVSGGNEIRAGAHRGMAMLARRLADDGIPVFRFDRAGVGDSGGENRSFAESLHDIFNASLVFGNETGVDRIVGFGNCDAASALALFGRSAGVDAVVLANPWTIEATDDLPPAAAIRAGYARQLRDPGEWLRLLRGNIGIRKAIRGLTKIVLAPMKLSSLATQVHEGIAKWGDDAVIILAEGDATAIAYADTARGTAIRTLTIPTASHSFAREADKAALEATIRDALR